jgi:hypothetical protein
MSRCADVDESESVFEFVFVGACQDIGDTLMPRQR